MRKGKKKLWLMGEKFLDSFNTRWVRTLEIIQSDLLTSEMKKL